MWSLACCMANGDFTKTVEIAARCGQDADCNPSSAAGFWEQFWAMIKSRLLENGAREIEDMDFKYTDVIN